MTRDTTTKRLFILAVAIGLGMASGPALAATVVIDPDASGISPEDDISDFYSDLGVTLSAVGIADTNVYAMEFAWIAPTSPNIFSWSDGKYFDGHWARSSSPSFRADFTGFLAEKVSIDTFSDRSPATLEAFGASGSLGMVTGFDSLAIASPGEGITHIVLDFEAVRGADFGLVDHLVITPQVPVIPLPPAVGMGMIAMAGVGCLRAFRYLLRTSGN